MDRVETVPSDVDDPLTISSSRTDDEVVLALKGELDPHTAPLLQHQVDHAIEAGASSLVLDLAQLGFIDSSGLRVIISAHKEMRSRDGRLVLRSPSPTARRLLDITGLLDHIEIGE